MARKPAPNYAAHIPAPVQPAGPTAEELAAEGVLTMKQAARFLGVKLATMSNMVKVKAVPTVKVGKLRRVLKVGLRLYLADLVRKEWEA